MCLGVVGAAFEGSFQKEQELGSQRKGAEGQIRALADRGVSTRPLKNQGEAATPGQPGV